MSITYNRSIPREGLVLALDAANKRSYPGTGTKWYDISGHNYGGVPFTFNMQSDAGQNPVFVTDNGGGFYFDGITSQSFFDADVTQRADIHLDYLRDFTIIQWLKPIADGATHNRFYSLDSRLDHTNDGIGLGFDKSGSNFDPFNFWSDEGSGYDEANDGAFNYASGDIHMTGLRRVGTDTEILNTDNYSWRVPTIASNTGTSGNVRATSMRIGGYRGANSSNYAFKGNIYNVMLWDRALSDAETKQVFAAFRSRFGV